MSFTDAADWTRPIVFASGAFSTSDFPDWSEGVAVVPNQGASIGGSSGVYGDASDGSVTFDGSTTVLGLVPSGSVYTMLRDIFCNNITVNGGVTVKPNGFRIFCAGTLTNNGLLAFDGNSASGSTGGVGITPANNTINSNAMTDGGGNGSINAGGGNGGNTANQPVLGGNGGIGGTAGSRSGGTGGNAGFSATTTLPPRFLPLALFGGGYQATRPAVYTIPQGGHGGGAGGSNSASVAGGGGGGGAGIIIVVAKAIAGTGTIRCLGGNGAVAPGANVASGGGGGGGAIIIVSASVSSGAVAGQTLNTNGGSGGAIGPGVQAGADGTAGMQILLAN